MKIGRKTAVMIVILLLMAFGWHIINTNHVHYEAQYGGGIEAVFHDDNRKWLTLLIAFIFALSFLKLNILPRINNLITFVINFSPPDIPLFVGSLSIAIQKGIIHPKVY